MKDNFIIVWEWFCEKLTGRSTKTKLTILGLLLSLFTGIGYSVYYFTPKLPNYVGCFWEGWYTYSLEGDRWRFRWFLDNDNPKQCQRKKLTGDWVDMNKNVDAGVGSDDVEGVEE